MAAPIGTIWGDPIVGKKNTSQGKIGIYAVATNTDTAASVRVQVWFATMYSCEDGSNSLYLDIGADVWSASTLRGSASISHPVSSGEGWNASNQTKIWDQTYSYDNLNGNRDLNIYAKYNGIDLLPNGTMYASTSLIIVSYNANGGSGAPVNQLKHYGKTLTLSSTIPTRTGYIFKGWSASQTATSASWSAGGSYTDNAPIILYAVWEAVTYTVSYNANGGFGAPGSQIKTHGQDLTLSTVVPTRTNYTFKGWGTSASAGSATYSAGGTYSNDEAITLYAVWELAYVPPRIIDFIAYRVNGDGFEVDDGTFCACSIKWKTDKKPASIEFSFKEKTASDWNIGATLSGLIEEDPIQAEILNNELGFSADKSYDIKATVSDSLGSSYVTYSLMSAHYVIDFLNGGKGVSFGKAAETENVAEFGWDIRDKFGTRVNNGLAMYTGAGGDAIDPDTTLDELILTNKNSPISGKSVYIRTIFHGSKSDTSDRAQIAIPYDEKMFVYRRYYKNNSWSQWYSSALDPYPVNSIYISYSHTSPAELFGGTWTRIEDRFLWGCKSTESIGDTGGESAHTLTVDEIPSHSHPFIETNEYSSTSGGWNNPAWGPGSKNTAAITGFTGGGAAHNNMPPYIKVSIWRRIA